jgi:hypothetical protein
VQVEARPAHDDDRPAGLGQYRRQERQPTGDGRLLVGPEHAVEQVGRLHHFARPWPRGQNRQIGEQLLAVGIDNDAVEPPRQDRCQGGLAAGRAATYDDQRLDASSPEPEPRCQPSPA